MLPLYYFKPYPPPFSLPLWLQLYDFKPYPPSLPSPTGAAPVLFQAISKPTLPAAGPVVSQSSSVKTEEGTNWATTLSLPLSLSVCCKSLQKTLMSLEWMIFEERKKGIWQVVPNCYRVPISKFRFKMLLFNLAQDLRKI